MEPLAHGPLLEMIGTFAHAFELEPGNPGLYTKSRTLALIMDVPRNAVVPWFRQHTPPSGERRAKLLLLLSLCGYEATERSSFEPAIRTFSDTIACVINVDGAAKELNDNTKKIMAWLRGDTKPKDMGPVIAFNRRHQDARNRKIAEWGKALHDAGMSHVKPAGPQAAVIQGFSSGSSPPERPRNEALATPHSVSEELIASAAHLVKAMKPLVDLVLAGNLETRERFRELAGQNNVFELKNGLTRLCGETAFKKQGAH